MSTLRQWNVARSRKRKWCSLCHEMIEAGDAKVCRSGTNGGDFWTMHMHPECEAYESRETVDADWYEDGFDPAFSRQDAINAKVKS